MAKITVSKPVQVSLLFILFSLLLSAFTCDEKPDSPVVAQVGDAVLTLNDIYKSMPPEYSHKITRQQNINFVKQWIDTELLYQEALNQKLHKEKEMQHRLEKMKQDLLCAEMLSRNALKSGDINITDDMVEQFFKDNRQLFVRDTPVYKYLQIVVDELRQAWQIRNKVTAENFLDLAAKYSIVPVEDPRSVIYLKETEIPPEVTAKLENLRVGGTTAPIKYAGQYSIIRLMDKQPAGTLCSLEEVRNDVIDRLTTQTQKKRTDEMLANLRLKTHVEVDFSLIPSNSQSATTKEK